MHLWLWWGHAFKYAFLFHAARSRCPDSLSCFCLSCMITLYAVSFWLVCYLGLIVKSILSCLVVQDEDPILPLYLSCCMMQDDKQEKPQEAQGPGGKGVKNCTLLLLLCIPCVYVYQESWCVLSTCYGCRAILCAIWNVAMCRMTSPRKHKVQEARVASSQRALATRSRAVHQAVGLLGRTAAQLARLLLAVARARARQQTPLLAAAVVR